MVEEEGEEGERETKSGRGAYMRACLGEARWMPCVVARVRIPLTYVPVCCGARVCAMGRRGVLTTLSKRKSPDVRSTSKEATAPERRVVDG